MSESPGISGTALALNVIVVEPEELAIDVIAELTSNVIEEVPEALETD